MATIFHPTDFTTASQNAFHHALRLSFDGHLTLIHVHPRGAVAATFGSFPKVRDTLSEWQAGGLPIAGLPHVRKVEAQGNHVAAVLAADLARHSADLVVLACHQREGIAAWLKPSVSQEFVRKARAPALFVPQGVAGFVQNDGRVSLDTVLIPVAGVPDPQVAVDAADALFALLGNYPQRVILMHAGKAPLQPMPVLPAHMPCELETVLMPGEPVASILAVAASHSPDLIVMTSAGHEGFLDALRGSTTGQVVMRAPCPVLVEPAPAYDSAPAV